MRPASSLRTTWNRRWRLGDCNRLSTLGTNTWAALKYSFVKNEKIDGRWVRTNIAMLW